MVGIQGRKRPPHDFLTLNQSQEVVKFNQFSGFIRISFLFSLLVDLKLGGGLQVFLYFLLKYAKPWFLENPIDLDTGKLPCLKGNLFLAKPSM